MMSLNCPLVGPNSAQTHTVKASLSAKELNFENLASLLTNILTSSGFGFLLVTRGL